MACSTIWRGASVVAAAGLAVAGEEGRSSVRRVDAPLLRISCDELPIQAPTPIEAREDQRDRPYHALVRVWSFPSREPLDVPIEQLRLLGALSAARVGNGEYYFGGIEVGHTVVSLIRDAPEDPTARVAGPGRRALAGRNPLVLARHAITVCDLFVPDESALGESTGLRGLTVDRATGAPLEGAVVRCGDAAATSGAEGRFEFGRTVTWAALLKETVVTRDGWHPFQMSAQRLSAAWVDRLLGEGQAIFTLARVAEEKGGEKLPVLGR